MKVASDQDTPSPLFSKRAVVIFLCLILRSDCCHAFCPRPPRLVLIRQRHRKLRCRIKLHQTGPGSADNYLSQLSSNDDGDDGIKNESRDNPTGELLAMSNGRKSPIMANVKSAFDNAANEVGKRTSELSSGFAGVAERGSSDVRSLAGSAKSGVERAARRGTRDIRRTTLRAQRAAASAKEAAVATGRGLSDIHFFDPNFEANGFSPIVNFSPKVRAEEIAGWIDSQAKSGTEAVSSKARTLVLNFTRKEDYQFGDVTKELMHRVASHEVNTQDMILLLKILLALGATVGPIAELLPFSFLIEALNISLEQKVGGKILEALSKTLDNRLVAALFTSDDKNLIGDVVKRSVLGGVLEFTGKSDYESGDIQRAVRRERDGNAADMKLALDVSSEFEEWDRLFVERIETEEYVGNRGKIMDMKIAMALEECEAISRS